MLSGTDFPSLTNCLTVAFSVDGCTETFTSGIKPRSLIVFSNNFASLFSPLPKSRETGFPNQHATVVGRTIKIALIVEALDQAVPLQRFDAIARRRETEADVR